MCNTIKERSSKTWKYLYLAVLKGWDEELRNILNRTNKIEAAIRDEAASPIIRDLKDPKIYLKVRPDMYTKIFFDSDLPVLRKHPSFLGDYSNYNKGQEDHIIVLKVPERFIEAFNNFLKGKYSKMYNFEEIMELYTSDAFKTYQGVLLKTREAKEDFIERLNEEFTTDFYKVEGDPEYDLPLKCSEEI